jgi:hypothetical protein
MSFHRKIPVRTYVSIGTVQQSRTLGIWHFSGPVNAGLKEFAVIVTELPDVREMNDNSSFLSATNEVLVMEFSLKFTQVTCLYFI